MGRQHGSERSARVSPQTDSELDFCCSDVSVIPLGEVTKTSSLPFLLFRVCVFIMAMSQFWTALVYNGGSRGGRNPGSENFTSRC